MKSCLVVDDSRVIRMVARKILEELSFKVIEAEDGKAALEACRSHLPDAVLLDWNMPVMDGMTFLKSMRKLPNSETVKVIFCTTHNDMEHIREAVEEGADEYIMKPFDSEIIQGKFQQVGLL